MLKPKETMSPLLSGSSPGSSATATRQRRRKFCLSAEIQRENLFDQWLLSMAKDGTFKENFEKLAKSVCSLPFENTAVSRLRAGSSY